MLNQLSQALPIVAQTWMNVFTGQQNALAKLFETAAGISIGRTYDNNASAVTGVPYRP
jgi:hypothetical protein